MGWLLAGSPLAGVAVGGAVLLAMKVLHMHESPDMGVNVLCMVSWLSFGLAELVDLSGIIATLFCAIVLSAFLKPKLEPATCAMANFQLRQNAALADMSIFMLVGVFVCLLGRSSSLGFSVLVVACCLVARACAIFPLGLLVNCVKRWRSRMRGAPGPRHLLSKAHLVMMWHAGLRGGIAMALCLEIQAAKDPEKLQEATLATICFFLVVFGGSTKAFLQYFEIPMGTDAPEDVLCKNRYEARHTSLAYSVARRASDSARYISEHLPGGSRASTRGSGLRSSGVSRVEEQAEQPPDEPAPACGGELSTELTDLAQAGASSADLGAGSPYKA